MKKLFKFKKILLTFGSLFLFASVGATNAHSLGYCGSGAATPPFLSGGVDPNLMLIFDNSASMLDLAYVAGLDTCFDDTYSNANAYAGYFDLGTWYAYDFTREKFVEKTDAAAATICGASAFTSSDVCIDGAVTSGELTSVTAFAAKGNLLNWATASKIDIQKEILTGGKYDSTDTLLTMESRGCGDRRFLKKVTVTGSGGTSNYLTLGIRPPREPVFDSWDESVAYSAGDVVNDLGDLYVASRAVPAGTYSNDEFYWDDYTETRWTSGVAYPAGSIVADPGKANTIDEGQLYLTAAGGTASGTGVDNDTGITDWVPYDTTHIEIFKVNTTGFDNSDCQLAVAELGKASPSQGQLKTYINGCMGYVNGGGSSDAANSHAAFNHAIHNCWYYAKHGEWPPGAGSVNSQKNACEDIYTSGREPWEITPDDRGYGCYGLLFIDDDDDAVKIGIGYVGRCWNLGTGDGWECTTLKNGKLKCKWVGTSGGVWDDGGYEDVDTCVEEAMRDYCGLMEIPEVIDPSDLVGSDTASTEEYWNIPAVLIDSGVVAQLDQPLTVLKGRIAQSAVPSGLIQEFAGDIRIGAMAFNDEGSKSECEETDPYVLYNCGSASNRDGGKVISEIDMSDSHTTDLVNALNDIKATSWTPIAEAIYNAVGYYTQRSALRLDGSDFSVGDAHDPITAWCQDNNVLIITEGASTADMNGTVDSFVAAEGHNDTDTSEDNPDCGILSGSTLLDDLTYYAKNSETLFDEQLDGHDKQNIMTHIVAAGTLRTTGTGECSPDVLLNDAAANGGTTLYSATDPAQLENALRDAFAAIRDGAAAGSAASVISASRGGEGAAYQAIFWASRDNPSGESVEWTGEVHSLLVDSKGFLFEDTNHNRGLDASDEKVVFYFDESTNVSKACNGDIAADGTCSGTSKALDQVHYLWSAAQWLSEIAPTADVDGSDILQNRTLVGTTAGYISTSKKRFVFTWNDLDNDGIVDSGEVLDFDPTVDWADYSTADTRGPVPLDFGVQTSDEVNEIVKWVRGLDQTGQRSRGLSVDFDLDGTAENVTWRMGDVVHSTPISVASPAEGFHFLYRDATYIDFVGQYKKRRHMIYFGGNDGMLHAVNGGFYDEINKRFCRTADCTDEGTTPSSSPELGSELWAYVPYNLLPHLKCLTETGYMHKYFVDQRPRIFDVRIFPDDTDHPNGWGTILVGAMRLGGARVTPGTHDLNDDGTVDYPDDNREFTSAYFILDITNPDKPPVLLGEMTRTTTGTEVDLAYTTAIPSIVTMKDGPEEDHHDWYLILGSGPTDVDGTSTQNGKIAVMPLSWLVDAPVKAFRIPDALPSVDSDEGGAYTLDADTFVSDLVTVDYELELNYKADAVYFGTVSGTWGGWGGKMYRLVTRKMDADGNQVATQPSEWGTLISPKSNPLPLIDVGQPVTASVSIGVDGKNFWIYFGTGRFFHDNDRTDASSNALQTFYGIKEPRSHTAVDGVGCVGEFTWDTVETTGTHDSTPGAQGLLRVDQIKVPTASSWPGSILSCDGGGTVCLPTGVSTYADLVDYIVGTGSRCVDDPDTGTDGWYKNLNLSRERNLGQATLLGGLVTYTTYQPFDEQCLTEGLGYLYGVYYQTGTSFFIPVFVGGDSVGVDDSGHVIDKVDLGRGLAKTPNLHVGKQEGAKAFVQTSTGTIVEIPQPNLPIRNAGAGRASWEVVR